MNFGFFLVVFGVQHLVRIFCIAQRRETASEIQMTQYLPESATFAMLWFDIKAVNGGELLIDRQVDQDRCSPCVPSLLLWG